MTILSDEATLSQQLRTVPLPVTHVLVEPVLSAVMVLLSLHVLMFGFTEAGHHSLSYL